MGDLMDFFDPRKPLNKVVLKAPDFGRVRLSAFDEPPPDTDEHHVCTQEEWAAFINKEEQKLLDAGTESVYGTSEIETVVRSDMDGIEGRSLNTMARTVAANDVTEDSVDLRKIYDFEHNEFSYKLPIIDMKERILSTVNGNQIVIISGPTGCGKSTQVPQYILDQHAMERKMVNIVVTQPRKIAASSVARRVCEERQWKIGGLVGYQVGLDRANKSPDTRLLYVTTGVLKRIIINKKNLNNYTHIILDEVHEREEDMDLVMLLCKKLLYTNSRGTKLILMSATLDEGKLRAYFASLVPRIGEVPAPVVPVGSKRNANPCFYLDKMMKLLRIHQLPEDDFIFDIHRPMLNEMCILLSKLIITNLDGLEKKDAERKGAVGVPGSVLVFLPGIQEISQVRECLIVKDIYSSKEYEWWIVPLHSSVSWEEQQVIYRTPPPGQRKIILSTNIAESSLTIPDIKYVVDFCLTKNVMSDKDTNYPRLMLDWASNNQLIQRNGRAGRVNRDGRVFALIPEFLKESLPESNVPEMLRVPLTKVVLDVKMLDMGSPKELLALAMDPPEIQSLQRTIIELKEIGAILTTVGGLEVRDDGDLTVLGEIVAKLPLDVKLGKMIFLGQIFGVMEEAIIMAAGLNGKSIFTAPFDKRVQAYKNKLYWANRTFSDCFAILLAYQSWEQRRVRGEFKGKDGQKREKDFCETAFLQRKSLMEMSMLVEDITRSLRLAHIEPLQIQAPVKWEGEQKFLILRLVMFGAFYPNYFQKNVSSEVEINAHRVLQGRDPKTTVYLQGMDEKHSPYGAIYSGQIKSLFKECYKEEDKIDLTFDGRKIFVEFARSRADVDRKVDGFQQDPNSNLTGEIIHQTYVACKLRSGNMQPNSRLKLKLYSSVDLAQEKHTEWQKVVKKAQEDRLTATELGQVTPPGMEVTELEVHKVTHISSPSTFWVHTAESVAQDNRVGQIIYQVLSRCTEVPSGQLREGQLFLAPYKDPEEEETNFYRAKVSRVLGRTSASVFFVDYGNIEVVSINNLRVIPSAVIQEFPDLVSIPGLALECCLGGVQPNQLRNGKGLWDEAVVRAFKELVYTHVGKINCKIFSVIKSCSGHSSFVVSLDTMVIKQEDNKSVDVKKQLVEDKLADVAVESYLSQEDHRERMRFNAYSSAMKTHLENPYSSLSLPNVASMKEDQSKQLISLNLHGPFNPLEHKVQCSYRTGSQKLCNVDPESVNAVLLDQSPSDPTDQWMVAAQVAMSPSSESLLIRNTSWMPAKPGLGSLATMIFSPQVELRGNKAVHKDKKAKGKHTRIIGFVAGLGPKTIFDKPMGEVTKSEKTHGYYPEHDMEVKLDVVISNGDVNMINKIRYWLNQMMMKSEDGIMHITQPQQLDSAQKGIQKYLVDLLNQERMGQIKTSGPCGRDFRWNMMPSTDQLKSKVDKDVQSQYVYKMINGIKMDASKDSEAALQHLIKLYSLWDPMDVNPLPYHEVCPVCPGQLMMTTPRDLHYHLNTAAHKMEESLVLDTPDTVATGSVAGASSSISRR